MKTAAALAPLLVAALAAGAHAAPGSISAQKAWTRPAAPGGNAAGYVTLVNAGGGDTLAAAASPAARQVVLHATSMAAGVMRMGAEAPAPIPAHGELSLEPGGRHLMFIGLKHPIRPGERVPATLRFGSGATLKVEFAVTAGAPDGAMGHMAGMH
jgi:copper(I)-binding protein